MKLPTLPKKLHTYKDLLNLFNPCRKPLFWLVLNTRGCSLGLTSRGPDYRVSLTTALFTLSFNIGKQGVVHKEINDIYF